MSTLYQEDLVSGIKYLENYFANSIVPQLFVDSEMLLRNFTAPAGELFAIFHEDIGKNIHNVKDKIGYNALIENIRGVLLTERNKESEIQTRDGRLFKMNIQPCFCQRDEQTEGVIITFLDLSGRVSIMKEVEKLNAEHETLMFALSHEIKQPLSTIILLKDALIEAFKNQDVVLFHKWVGNLKRTSKSIKFLVDQITEPDLSVDSATLPGEQVHFKEVFRDVFGMLREEVQNDMVSIDTDFGIYKVAFTKKNLRSIVYNLLGNAIKYRNPEKDLEILLSTKREDHYVILTVQDNGIGISKEDQRGIFEKSARFNRTIEGTGMGLYIIKRMMENNGGKIEVESDLGKGSKFILYFKDIILEG